MRQRTGTIDLTTAGRHRVRLPTPHGTRATLGTYDTLEEAETMRAAALAVLHGVADDGGVTLGAWGERWLTDRQLRHAVRDTRNERSRWENHLAKDKIARITLRSLRKRHVLGWLKRSALRGQTARNTLTVLRGMLAAAHEAEHVRDNVAKGVTVKDEKRTEETWTFLTPEEQRALVEAGATPVERAAIAFAIGTGLRAGELVTLRLADVHPDGQRPHVVVRYGTAPNLPTKSGKIRRVPLFGLALEAVRAWLPLLPRFARKNPHRLLFPGARGAFRNEDHVLRWDTWKAAREAAGLTRRVRWHDLRHTCASSLVSGFWGRSWSLPEVKAMLGHAAISTTERYAHLAGTALDHAAAETQLATIGHGFTAHRENGSGNTQSGGFVNRRSPVQARKAAPSNSAEIAAVPEMGRGRLLATSSRALLEAAADGRDAATARLATILATAVLDEPSVRLALDVLADGPHAVRCAIDLASLFVEAATPALEVAP